MTTTDSRGLLATHDHGSRQPGAGPALAPAPERQESAFAAVRRICGGRVHGVRLYRLCAVGALADAPPRCSGAAGHRGGGGPSTSPPRPSPGRVGCPPAPRTGACLVFFCFPPPTRRGTQSPPH